MTMRIFIGSEPKTEIAAQVLMHSIKTRTQRDVEFTLMVGPDWEYPIKGIKVGTGFSLRRWMIPKACDWHGYALYLDADQIVFADIGELWDIFANAQSYWSNPVLWTTYQKDKYNKTPAPQTSVMGIDCDNAMGKWGFEIEKILAHLRGHPDKETYARFMHAEWLMPKTSQSVGSYNCFDEERRSNLLHPLLLPIEWNHLNVYQKDVTKLLHFTKEDTQPWVMPSHKLAGLWRTELKSAIKAGVIPKAVFQHSLSKFGVKEDWRPTNGLHPSYKDLLPFFPSGV